MKHILLVNQSTGYLMTDIVNAFVQSGKYDRVELFTGEINIRPSIPDPSVRIIKTIKYNKKNTFCRLYSWFIAYVHLLFLVWCRGKNCELFLVTNPPLTTFIPSFTRKEYSFLIYDLYPDSLFSQGFLKQDSFLARMWMKTNARVFARAKNVFTISNDMKNAVSRYLTGEKITVVYNWAHNEHLKPIDKQNNVFLKQYGISDKFIVLYSGNMGMTHDIDVMVEVAKQLKDQDEIRFLFIGEGAKKSMIEKGIEDYGLNNCLVLPFQPLDILPYSMGAADIAVVTTDAKQTGLSVPSKTYSYLAVGSVLLCLADSKSELGRMVEENRIGRCFNRNDVTSIARFVETMVSDRDLCKTYRNNSRNLSTSFTQENAKQYVV